MAVSAFKTFIAGEILTASDLNSSFSQVFDNGEDLAWPATKAKDFDGFELILDSDADSSFTADTDDRLDLKLKGTDLFRWDGTATTPVNGLDFIASETGSNPSVAAVGSDTNLGITLTTKGTGQVALSGRGLHFADSSFPSNFNSQPRSGLRSDIFIENGTASTGLQGLSINGTLAGTTISGFTATATPDVVCLSGWGLRGSDGTNPLIPGNIGSWFEGNTALTWTLEVDCLNEGATQSEGDDTGGVGILLNTGSTYSPDTALSVRRVTGAGTGPGWLRGIDISGARNVGVRVAALATAGLTPAAPSTIQAIQVLVGGDSQTRWMVDQDGDLNWGSGSATHDAQLMRSAAGEMTYTTDINSKTVKASLIMASNISADSSAVGEIFFAGKDDGDNSTTYGSLLQLIADNTDGTEDGQMQIWQLVNNTSTKIATFGGGLAVGNATGGDQGVATVNATTYYAGGTSGLASFGPAAPSSITVKGGLITAAS